MQPNKKVEDAVILVDSKIRDLDVAALIAHHLGNLGIKCHLEPLEAYRAVIGAHKPGLIVFNHLNASHLIALSKRLHNMGILTAVLPNEGILYDKDVARFYSNRYHNGSHIDYFLCWNDSHRDALLAEGFSRDTHVEVVGVPRFDFYFEPWSKLTQRPKPIATSRPRILFCTNLSTADYWELPKEQGDKLFAMWVNRIPLYTDYWPAIEAQWKGRNKIPAFLEALIASDRFEVIFRPHPVETVEFYEKWMGTLSSEQRTHFRYDRNSNVSGLILDCDLEISVETCTTALEAWICKKPTVELVLEKHPLWYREIQAKANVPCEDPAKLPDLVTKLLNEPLDLDIAKARAKHLADWCATPDGTSSLRIARLFANALYNKKPADWSKLTLTDKRRAAKLRTMNALGQAYHFDPMLAIKRTLFRERYAMKDFTYRKSIMPKDVSEALQRLENAEDRNGR